MFSGGFEVENQGQNRGCKNCAHYYITWDVKFPYGCRLFGFKSKGEPSMTVFKSLGKKCDNFIEKERKK